MPKTIVHIESDMDLIPANKRLADAAARLQEMQLSQYGAGGETGQPSRLSCAGCWSS